MCEQDTALKNQMTAQNKKTTLPKVSVVIPCFNQAPYLKEAVSSVIRQSYQNWEIIIVNDGSTDNSEDIAKECAATDSRIVYISQPNQGASTARNTGIKASKGKYILPLDGDDTIETDYLTKAVEYLEAHPECACFYCHANMFGSINQPWDVKYIDYKHLLTCNAIFCSSVYRRTDFDIIGGYDETFIHGYEDWEFYIRLLANGGEVYQDDTRMFNYRKKGIHEHSLDSISHKYEESILNTIYKKHIDLYIKHFPSFIASQRKTQEYTDRICMLEDETNRLTEDKKRLSKKLTRKRRLILVLYAIIAVLLICLFLAL